MRPLLRLAAPPALAVVLLLAGCATDRGASRSGDSATSSGSDVATPAPRGSSLPARLSSRWSAPDFATRIIDAERAPAFDAAIASANALGYSVHRTDGAFGKISATRRQPGSFGGAREDTLEITVTQLAPGSTKVAVSLRELVEPARGDERSGGIVTTALVRDRAPYDAFFDRLAAQLAPAAP